jgi:hypothetical protein
MRRAILVDQIISASPRTCSGIRVARDNGLRKDVFVPSGFQVLDRNRTSFGARSSCNVLVDFMLILLIRNRIFDRRKCLDTEGDLYTEDIYQKVSLDKVQIRTVVLGVKSKGILTILDQTIGFFAAHLGPQVHLQHHIGIHSIPMLPDTN